MTSEDHADHPEPGSNRQIGLVVLLAVGIVVIPTVLALVFLGRADSTQTFTIPAGTGARIAAGEPVRVMPKEIKVHVGDHVVIDNQDDRSYVVGPLAVRPNERLDHRFDAAGVYVGACSLQPEGEIRITVS